MTLPKITFPLLGTVLNQNSRKVIKLNYVEVQICEAFFIFNGRMMMMRIYLFNNTKQHYLRYFLH